MIDPHDVRPSPSRPRRRVVGTVLAVVGGVCLLLAAPCVMFGVLGFLGIMADVSPGENRIMGLQFLGLAAIPAVIGIVLLVVSFRLRATSASSSGE